jgi:hypothetical protein
MARNYVGCRDYPQGEKKCTVAPSADSEEELLDAVALRDDETKHGRMVEEAIA